MLFLATLLMLFGFVGTLVTLEAAANDPTPGRGQVYALVMLAFASLLFCGLLIIP